MFLNNYFSIYILGTSWYRRNKLVQPKKISDTFWRSISTDLMAGTVYLPGTCVVLISLTWTCSSFNLTATIIELNKINLQIWNRKLNPFKVQHKIYRLSYTHTISYHHLKFSSFWIELAQQQLILFKRMKILRHFI